MVSEKHQVESSLSAAGGAIWKPDVFSGSVGWPGVRLNLDGEGGSLLPNGRLAWKLASANTVANPDKPEMRFEWPQVLRVEKTKNGSRAVVRFTVLLNRRQRRFTFWTPRKKRLGEILAFAEARDVEVTSADES